MSEIVLSRVLSRVLAPPAKCPEQAGNCGHGLQDKSADRGLAHVVDRISVFERLAIFAAVARRQFANEFNMRSACLAET